MALCSSPVSHILRNFDTSINDDLARKNYTNWRVCIKSYLLSQDLWEVIEASSELILEDSGSDFKIWRKKNAAALLAIQNSCEPDILSQIGEITSAKVAWDTLAKIYEPEPSTVNSGQPAMEEEPQLPTIVSNDLTEVQKMQAPTISNAPLLAINPGDLANPRPQPAAANQGIQNIDYSQLKPLLEAINKGDWDLVRNFLDANPGAIKAKITLFDETPLHVAILGGHLKIAENLVELMSEEDFEMKDCRYYTALHNAAASRIKIAERIIRKNKKLVTILEIRGNIPLLLACTQGHKDMSQYLYSVTPLEFLRSENGIYGSVVLSQLIYSRMFGKNSRSE